MYCLLEAEGFTCWLLNARHVKNVPGRPRTDKLDAVWLAKVAERGMCRPSLVHPGPIRELRDLTRCRRSLIRERTAKKQRAEKLLEDAQIKLTSVASSIFRGLRPAGARRDAGRPARPEGPGPHGARPDARQDPPAARSAGRRLHRPATPSCSR